MGGKSSKKSDNDPINRLKLINIINHIAAKLIFQTGFQEKLKLHKPEYCKKLVILTSKILNHFFNPNEITVLSQHLHGDTPVNKLALKKLVVLDISNIKQFDINTDLEKKRACFGVAKFYIKIAHLFSAISMTFQESRD